MIEKLREINESIISKTTDEDKKKKHILIRKILNDKDCFFKMNIETSYALLRELMVPEDKIKDIYSKLIEK